MPDRTPDAYEKLDQWEQQLTEAKVRNLSGQYGLTRESLEDLRQELLLHLWLKRQDRAYWNDIRASEKTVVSHILDNKIRDLLRTHLTKRNQVMTKAEALAALPEGEEDRTLPALHSESFAEDVERRVAIERILRTLTPLQAVIARLYMQNFTTAEIAPMLGMHRTSVVRQKKRLRQIFYRRGIKDSW